MNHHSINGANGHIRNGAGLVHVYASGMFDRFAITQIPDNFPVGPGQYIWIITDDDWIMIARVDQVVDDDLYLYLTYDSLTVKNSRVTFEDATMMEVYEALMRGCTITRTVTYRAHINCLETIMEGILQWNDGY